MTNQTSDLLKPPEKIKDPVCPICGGIVDEFYGSWDAGYKCWKHGKVEPVSKQEGLF